jgi:outer membrane protein assembly factor BamB
LNLAFAFPPVSHSEDCMFRALLLLTLTFPPAPDAKSNHDWPQWRGPNRDAVCTETGLLNSWPDGGPKLLWSAKDVNKGPSVGAGMSSLAIASGKIYTLGDRDGKGNLICLDEATGKVLWATPFSATRGGGSDPGPRATPTVDGNRVYALSPHGDLACFDARSGKIVWTKNCQKDFGGHMMSGWSYSESATIDGDKLICTPGGKKAAMVALKKDTGELIWKCEVPVDSGAGYASIVTAEVGGIRQYISLLGPQLGLIGVDAQSGKFLWSYKKMANGTANIPTALVKGDLVFASTAYGAGAALLRLVPDGKGGVDAKEVYFLKANTLQNHHGGMVLIGDHVYGGHGHNDGQPFCLELKTGKLKWGPERGAGSGSAAVLYADGNLYFRYDNNEMALVEANPNSYNLRSNFHLPKGTSSPGWQHPVIHDGKLYIRANDQLYCYDIKQK